MRGNACPPTGARRPLASTGRPPRIEATVGIAGFLGQIRESLKSGEFRPVEVRQVRIPKGRSGRFRKLGIPTIADRVVQASLKLVLEPIFEADFKSCSYGFRPNRRAHDAIAEIHHYATSGYEWVLEADVRACFDEISHTALMTRLRTRITDKRVCALVKAFLKSGILTELGIREETPAGTPQGGILSPLLANIALSVLDDHFDQQWQHEMGDAYQRAKRRRNGEGNWKLTRYADDFVLTVSGDRHHADALRDEVSTVLALMGRTWRRTKPAWSTSTRASISSASTSDGCGNGAQRSTTSTPPRPRRPSRRPRTRCATRRAGQPCT